MGITFNTNLSALTGQRYIGIASGNAASSLAKLSSGSRVPQAKDDAAGLSIGSKLKAEVAALTQDANNAGQAISLLQIADGALSTVGDILQRMKSLAVQSSSGQLADADRSLLNQEFSSLQDEVDRVAATANFNGTNLLSGSTKVTADTNNLVAANNTDGIADAASQIGQGFEKFEFADDFGDGAVKVDFNKDSNVLTLTDLVSGKKQSVSISADSAVIAAGDTETYNFGDLGVKVTINSLFNKTANITSANVAYVNPTAAHLAVTAAETGTGVWTPSTETLSYDFNGTGGDAFTAAQLSGAVVNLTNTSGTAFSAAVTIGTHVFTSVADVDLGSAAPATITLSDGVGNTFTIGATVGTPFDGAETGVSLTIGTTGVPAVDSSTNGKPALLSVTTGTDSLDANGDPVTTDYSFNYGDIDNATVVFTTTNAATSSASIDLNGHTFSATGINLTSTGVKTITLTDQTTGYGNNSITFTMNVTAAFDDGDGLTVELGDLGQVVGAKSDTSGSTTFSFKVGTGTTANDDISFDLNSATTTALGISSSSIDTAENANNAITAVTTAITTVSSLRADVGAAQSRLGFAQASINVAIENTTAAQSSLLDVDVSSEITKFTSQQVLLQAGISLLAQANQQPSLLLRLLQ